MDTSRQLISARSAAIEQIRHEHSENLMVCSNIRNGLLKGVEIHRIKRYADWYWKNHLMKHFSSEEKMIFPMLGDNNDHVNKAMTEHRRLKRLFENKEEINKMLSRIEEELEAHVRFEERILLKEIEKLGTVRQLELIATLHQGSEASTQSWQDEFWK